AALDAAAARARGHGTARQERKPLRTPVSEGAFRWCGTRDSNPELLPCKGSTLPVELIPHAVVIPPYLEYTRSRNHRQRCPSSVSESSPLGHEAGPRCVSQ